VPIERPQVDVAGGAAGWAARPQKPIAGRDSSADRRREQHRHPLGLALVPHRDQVVGILKDLPLGRAARGGFLLRLLLAGIVHFALVEAHGSGIMDQGNGRIEVGPKQMSRLVRVLDDKDVVERAANFRTKTMIRDLVTIAIVAFAISFVAITEVMLSLM
jgi:hypothetical protein